jgi:hypothetical protein
VTLGQAVEWVTDDDGHPYLPFIMIPDRERSYRWNHGDARFRNVIILDEEIYTGDHVLSCPQCGTSVAAIACRVRDGTFDTTWALEETELEAIVGRSRDKANCIVVMEDGSFEAREDWYDAPFEFLSMVVGSATI